MRIGFWQIPQRWNTFSMMSYNVWLNFVLYSVITMPCLALVCDRIAVRGNPCPQILQSVLQQSLGSLLNLKFFRSSEWLSMCLKNSSFLTPSLSQTIHLLWKNLFPRPDILFSIVEWGQQQCVLPADDWPRDPGGLNPTLILNSNGAVPGRVRHNLCSPILLHSGGRERESEAMWGGKGVHTEETQFTIKYY